MKVSARFIMTFHHVFGWPKSAGVVRIERRTPIPEKMIFSGDTTLVILWVSLIYTYLVGLCRSFLLNYRVLAPIFRNALLSVCMTDPTIIWFLIPFLSLGHCHLIASICALAILFH